MFYLGRDTLQPVPTQRQRLQLQQFHALERDLLEPVPTKVQHLQLQGAEVFGQRKLVQAVVLGYEGLQPGQPGNAFADGRQSVVADVQKLEVGEKADRRGEGSQAVVVQVQLPGVPFPLLAKTIDVEGVETQAREVEDAVPGGRSSLAILHFGYFSDNIKSSRGENSS